MYILFSPLVTILIFGPGHLVHPVREVRVRRNKQTREEIMSWRTLFAASAASLVLSIAPASAQSAEDFYAGKTLRVVSSTGAGGTMDLYLLLFMKYAEKHLPKGASLVLDHRTGGGGAIMANYMYNQAPKDGSEFGMPVPALVSATFSTPDQARYEPAEFNAVGRLVDLPRVFVARADSGIKSIEDAVNHDGDVTHGIMTVGTSLDQFMTVANEALGTKFRRVAGYSGGGPTFLAMEQGEVMSTTAEPANLLANKWHLVESGDVNVLATLGLEPVPGLENVPNMLDLVPADNPRHKHLTAVAQSAALGLALIAPPGVPEDRIAYLRDVFEKAMTDPELVAEAKQRNIPLNFKSGAWLQDLIVESSDVDDEVKTWFADLLKNQ